MRINAALSAKIRMVSLFCSIAVVFNHAFALRAAYQEQVDAPFAAMSHFVQVFAKYGVGPLTTPFFFIVSAFLLLRTGPSIADYCRAYPAELSKRVRSVLWPLLIWSTASLLLVMALQELPMSAGHFGRALSTFSAVELLGRLLWDPVAYPLWFLRELFLLALISPIYRVVFAHRMIALLCLAGLLSAYFFAYENRHTRSFFFFGLGAYLALHPQRFERPRLWEAALAMVAWLSLSAAHTIYIMRFGAGHPVLNNINVITGLLAVWTAYDQIEHRLRHPLLARISGFTFLVYVSHEPLTTLVRKGLVAVLGSAPLETLAAFLVTAVSVLVICNGMAMLLQRHAPSVCAVIGGGRSVKIPSDKEPRAASGSLVKSA